MVESERSNKTSAFVNEGLNVIGDVAEKSSNFLFMVTALKSAEEILRNQSPRSTLLKGAALAVFVRGVSAIADLGVDTINKLNGLA